MFSFKILFVCAVINSASSYPYGHGQLLNAPAFNFPKEYSHAEQRPVTYSKQFHFFAAPEETESYDEIIPESALRKNVRVVVIKAPENNRITTAIARLAKTLSEEKTAIYVLNKEPDLKEITTQIDILRQEKTAERPEVHFIKYKTPEEAELAAINIQSQYETLDGPSKVNKAETASLHSYVGSLNGAAMDTKLGSLTPLGLDRVPLSEEPLHVSLPLLNVPSRGETKINPSLLAALAYNNLVVSTTTSPLGELNISDVSGTYLPPEDIKISSGKYLPPDNNQGSEKGRGETKINPSLLAALAYNNLVVSTTTSPLGELNISDVSGTYLPPEDIKISSGKYLPPDNNQGSEKGRGETKLSTSLLAALAGTTFNKLVVPTTTSPLGELNNSDVSGTYLPPRDVKISSGKYLPPDNFHGSKKRSVKPTGEKVDEP